jgi:hypothetical protein
MTFVDRVLTWLDNYDAAHISTNEAAKRLLAHKHCLVVDTRPGARSLLPQIAGRVHNSLDSAAQIEVQLQV